MSARGPAGRVGPGSPGLTVPLRGSVTGDFYCLSCAEREEMWRGVSIMWYEAWGKILAWE